MSDAEFQVFCKKFLLMKKSLNKAYDEINDIEWYLLTENTRPPKYKRGVYDHTKYFNQKEEQEESYNNIDHKSRKTDWWTWMDNTPLIHWDKTTAEFWFQRYIAKWLAGDRRNRDARPDRGHIQARGTLERRRHSQ